MDTRTSEIAEGIHRFSTFVPGIGPTGLTFSQHLCRVCAWLRKI